MAHASRTLASACLGLVALMGATAALAQMGPVGPTAGPAIGSIKPAPGKETLPPALPGARTRGEVAPPERMATDMPPTEALFDSINRGDLAGARDAITRGADLNGHNVLSLTPIDLSVDLGRNDITFLLLSLRGATGYSNPAASAGRGKPGPATAQAAAAAAPKPAAPPAPVKPVARAKPAPAPAAAPAAKPRQFVSGDPGTPSPQAGFLGFGGQRP